jgi:pimeloyl-ACP methyl ester carboxylesterase
MAATPEANTGATAAYAAVNGLDMYYEMRGTGAPLVLIPGGLMTIAMMGPIVPTLAQTRQVIAVEPQAHGHTRDVDRPLTYEQMADDTAALISHLHLERADVLGFSAGGGVALQIAIRHPEVVRKLVVVSGTYRGDGEFAEIRAFTTAFDPDLPMLSANRDAYLSAAPTAGGWAPLVTKMRELLRQEYDWSAEVAAIRAPTLIVVGDADTMPPAHAVELFGLLGGGTPASAMGAPSKAHLAVLPGTTHFRILHRLDLLLPILTAFLDSPTPAAV